MLVIGLWFHFCMMQAVGYVCPRSHVQLLGDPLHRDGRLSSQPLRQLCLRPAQFVQFFV